jgi:hypothetical protein
MTSVRTSLVVAAPPDRVWAVLTDFAAYPQWNAILSRVRAELREGGAIRFRIKIEATPELAFAARIVRCAPGRELAWRGGAPLVPALAWGEHYFRLEPAGDGTVLTHGEDFGGLLALVVRGPVHARVTRTYEAFNRALKARAESTG